uniref:pyruvate decarboxylase n=1 Tax=Medicago truncatula TaxID=3880 RepID=I3SW02_MEDTR|nr:unknown [Medicago truncatula]
MIRHGLKPIIFVLNNKGYTIERMIHGMEASYNDIQPWNHTAILNLFSADPRASRSYQIKTKTEAEQLFNDQRFSSAPYIQLVEVFMPWQDAPRALVKVAEITAKRNSA